MIFSLTCFLSLTRNNELIITRGSGRSAIRTLFIPLIITFFIAFLLEGYILSPKIKTNILYIYHPKVDLLLYYFIRNQLLKIIYPRAIINLKYNNNKVEDKLIASIISFIYLYILIFFVLASLLTLTGLDFITSISGAASSLSNVGPGLGNEIGPNSNYSGIPDQSKWLLSVGMILGRLEIFAILIIFLPSFWRK